MAAWDPELYLRFAAERTRPAVELAARVAVAAPKRVIDLGCGTGTSTEILRARWPDAEIVGLDTDDAMLAAARKNNPELKWVNSDAGHWRDDGAWDVVFSNAMLQWLPDHAEVVQRYFAAVRPGGALAMQFPSHPRASWRRIVRELANEAAWHADLLGAEIPHVQAPEFYYAQLAAKCVRIDLWETEYYQAMEGPKAILDWVRATGLRPYLAALKTDRRREEFERELLERFTRAFPRQPDGKVLFPFPRTFFIAYRE
ncbi:MAG TPA: methyltransferase domain-containing protein [Planctomycetia bacterium]|nr:methyltransferase domain-containing protein [Planctomycetia bacterium]